MDRVSLVKILICDDSSVERKVLTNILSKMGCDVTAVSSGKSAVEELAKSRYDLLFLDLIMPEQDGWETAKEIRKKWNAEELPIIAVSSISTKYDVEKAVFCGVNSVLKKPFNVDDIENAINGLG